MSLLPFVKKEIGPSLAKSISSYDIEILKKELSSIKKENPHVAEFIREFSLAKRTSSAIHCAICGALVYKMLRSQAEADQMAKEIRLE